MKLAPAAVAAVILSASYAGTVPAQGRPAPPSISKAVVKVSDSVVSEGDRLTVRVRVPQAGDARRVVLQERRMDALDNPTWDDVDSKRARGRVTFKTVVTATNDAVFRVAVTYQGRTKPVLSKSVKVTVWRWIPLQEFPPYFETTSYAGYGSDTMNGNAYATWGLHYGLSFVRAYESRITPGRHCTAFRAVLGLSDRSDDGSSGAISFTADEVNVYQSPALVPGMTVPVEFELARPYRFGMAATNTSADKVAAYPMVGNGEFYCTGIPA